MRAQGFDAYLSGTQPTGPRRFRVRVVPGDSEDIEGLVRRLRAQGYDTWTTRE